MGLMLLGVVHISLRTQAKNVTGSSGGFLDRLAMYWLAIVCVAWRVTQAPNQADLNPV